MHRVGMLLLVAMLATALPVSAQENSELSWIWTPEATTSKNLPMGGRNFRKVVTIDRPIANPVDLAQLEIAADDEFTLWFNGKEVGSGKTWQKISTFDVKPLAKHGKNVIAINVRNTSIGAAALLCRGTFIPNGKSAMSVVSDGSWKSAHPDVDQQWQQIDFDDSKWESCHVLGPYGSKPWGMINWPNGPTSSRFTVPQGFVVDTVIPPNATQATGLDPKLPFSLINMTFDAKGRLLVSQERGPVLLCTEPDAKGTMQKVKPYCKQVKSAQGLCWVKDALLVVGDGPKGTGLYRVKDTNGDDEVDDVQLIHKFKGGMGEHGPHAIIHGPNDWLYLVIGNHAWAQPEKLADNSPLKRWPTGYFGPDQGKPNTTEDVLLPRLNDARGHAANILAPGGTIWRMDMEGKNMSLVAAGFRNHFDAAFRASDGELFTFDSDMEWDESLPWYRPVRVCHVPMGADFAWRTGAANTPNYYLDSLPPMVETGRGSPCGVAVYEHVKYPQKYRGSIFLADWSIGVIWAVQTKASGATFQGEAEKFCVGSPLNVTDLETGPDGAVYFTLGGRGSAGGVYRIRYTGALTMEETAPDRIQPLAAWSKGRNIMKVRGTLLSPERKGVEQLITEDLKSGDARKQRLACEDSILEGITIKAELLWPLLNSNDPYLRTAARLVLQRNNPQDWIGMLGKLDNLQAMEAIVALCKTNQLASFKNAVLDRLANWQPSSDMLMQLYQLRTWQLVCIHGNLDGKEPALLKAIDQWMASFTHGDPRVNRELAILLTHAHRSNWTTLPIPGKLLEVLLKTSDRQQAIHYFYCLRLLNNGWTSEHKQQLVNWFEKTSTWTGGHSFTPFMENIFREWATNLSVNEKQDVLAKVDSYPFTCGILLRDKALGLTPAELVKMIKSLKPGGTTDTLRDSLIENLGRDIKQAEVQVALRQLADEQPALLEQATRALVKAPSMENAKYYVAALRSTSPILLKDATNALLKTKYVPGKDDAEPYHRVLLAVGRLNEKDRLLAIKLLQKWKAQRFSAEGNDLTAELTGWSRWYGQQFPKATPLPNVASITATSKWKFAELKQYLESDPKGRAGDVARGKVVFTKANCIKCHKYGKEGEGLGPDLTTLKSRFQRADMLEALLDPSKTISDQYRGTVIVTVNGQTVTGLAAPQGDSVTVLQTDGTKVTLKKNDIESQVASTVSPMPEKLIDELTLQEIADLFAYLESVPK
jgi:putative heme-binding domain-containing protein